MDNTLVHRFLSKRHEFCRSASRTGKCTGNRKHHFISKSAGILAIWLAATCFHAFSSPQPAITNSVSNKELYKKAQSIVSVYPDSALIIAHQLLQNQEPGTEDMTYAKSNYLIATANLIKGKYIIASEYFLKAIDTNYARHDKTFAEACWNNLGIAFDYQQKYDKAIEAYQKSFEITSELKDSASMMQTIINLGLLDEKEGNRDKAVRKFQEALTFFSKRNDSVNAGLCLQNIGKIHADAGEYHMAIPLYQRALNLFEGSGYLPGKTEILLNLAKSYHDSGNLSASLKAIGEMQKANQNLGNIIIDGLGNQLLGANHLSLKQYKKAETFLLEALKTFEKANLPDKIESTLLILKNLHAQAGNFRDYEIFGKRLEDVRNNNRNQVKMQVYNELAELYEHQKYITQIEEQKAVLRSKSNQLTFLMIILLAVSALAIYTFFLYLKVDLYKKFRLFAKTSENQSRIPGNADEPVASSEETRINEIYHSIIHLLNSKKIYRDNNLTVTSLALELNTNERYISKAINRHSQSNFTSLINKYRINEACSLLLNNDSRYKVSEIARRVGYGDPSTFYRHFKEITGLTPAQYTEMHDEETAEPNTSRIQEIKRAQKNLKHTIQS